MRHTRRLSALLLPLALAAACHEPTHDGPMGDGGGKGDGYPEPTSAPCWFQAPGPQVAPTVLALAAGREICFLRADQTQEVVHVLGEDAPSEELVVEEVLGRGRFVAVRATLFRKQGEQVELVLLDTQGGRLWNKVFASTSLPSLHLNERGFLAVSYGNGRGEVVRPTDHRPRADASPIGEVSAEGYAPVVSGPFATRTFSWRSVDGRATLALAHPVDPSDLAQGGAPRWLEGRLVYRTKQAGAAAGRLLVAERPGHAVTLPLPAGRTRRRIRARPRPGVRRLGCRAQLSPSQSWRVNLETAVVAEIATAPPSGFQVLEGPGRGRTLGEFRRVALPRLQDRRRLGALHLDEPRHHLGARR